MEGDVPIRDFWASYPPGQFYLLAYLFRLFGVSLAVERILDLVVRTSIAVLVYWLCAGLASPLSATVAATVALLWLGGLGFHAYAMFPALLLQLMGFCVLLRSLASQSNFYFFVAGLLCGAATVFKIEIGLLGVAATGAAMALAEVRRSMRPARGSGRWDGAGLIPLLLLAAGFVVPVGAVSLLMARVIPIDVLWETFISLPHKVLSEQLRTPAPPFIPDLSLGGGGGHFLDAIRVLAGRLIPFYAPPTVLALCFICAVREVWQDLRSDGIVSTGLSLFGLAVFAVLSFRPDLIHLFPATLMALILMSRMLYRVFRNSTRRRSLSILGACVVLFSASYVIIPIRSYQKTLLSSIETGRSHLQRAGFVRVAQDQEQAVAFIRSEAATTERIYVGLTSHDRIFICDVMFYFLSGRHSATRYHHLVPGVATTEHVQREIVESIQRYGVRFVVLCRKWADYREPNLSSVSSGVTLLDDFLNEHFGPVAGFGAYTILKRKGAAVS